MKTIELLVKFVNQRPGLDFANYGDYKAYNLESRKISADKRDFHELLSFALRRVADLDSKVECNLTKSSGRLTLKDGKIEYCTGQYWPTEYRPAASRILAQIIFNDFGNEIESNSPNHVYKDGIEIRKAIKKEVSRRVYKNYFA